MLMPNMNGWTRVERGKVFPKPSGAGGKAIKLGTGDEPSSVRTDGLQMDTTRR